MFIINKKKKEYDVETNIAIASLDTIYRNVYRENMTKKVKEAYDTVYRYITEADATKNAYEQLVVQEQQRNIIEIDDPYIINIKE